MSEPLVSLRRVGVSLSGVTVLDGLDLEIRPGEWHALLGPNGAGKTTLMRVLLGLLRPSAGAVVLRLPPDRGAVGVALGARNLHPGRRARTELLLRVRGNGGSPAQAARAWDACRIPHERARCGALSLGQAQRLSLMAALAHRPRLVVLDEPTVGLDLDSVAWLRDLLAHHVERGGAAFVSSHDLSAVERSATTVTVLDGGRATYSGSLGGFVDPAPHVAVRPLDARAFARLALMRGWSTRTAGGVLLVSGASAEDVGRATACLGIPVALLEERHDDLATGLRRHGIAVGASHLTTSPRPEEPCPA